MEITGLSMAGRAQAVTDREAAKRAMDLLIARYLEQKAFPLPMPSPDDMRIVRVTPTIISVLDYTKGFGHTDLVAC
jgi:hypothetical protein